jgi:tetratricopeptide (TPR) repeat protein
VLGILRISTNRALQGIAEFEQALALDQNLAAAHALIGNAKHYLGRGEQTEAHVLEALRLSPRDNFAGNWMLWAGLGKLQLDANSDAVAWLRRSVETYRNYPIAHFILATALTRLGSLEEARAAAQAGLALDPDFTIRRFRATAPSDNPTFLAGRERISDGMRMAGIPEG